jgi:lysophospholipase L1-like esterase
MHGWRHSEQEYDAAFPGFLATIKASAPDAKLIWASTTTLKESSHLSPGDQTRASDERIAARNAIALKYVQLAGIDVDDLSPIGVGHPEYHSDNVHFNDQGIVLQAGQVAGHIEKMLKP